MLINHEEPIRTCRERATLQVWSEHDPAPPEPNPGAACTPPREPFPLQPGELLHARIRLEHCHHLHGPIEPLLGNREVTLRVGSASFRDAVALDSLGSATQPIDQLGPIPEERLDPRVYFSPPDSLYLDAALPGFRSFQFRDMKIPHDAAMRLRFRYFRSVDSTGEARVELKQYQDVPNSYRALTEAKRVECLELAGEWVLVEHRFRSESSATTAPTQVRSGLRGRGSLGPLDRRRGA